MIRNFSDHAANERTFLAWVRTAIAVMAFGFLVARFNLFLRMAVQSVPLGAAQPAALRPSDFGNLAGLALIAAGTAMVTVAAIRFIRTGKAIDSTDQRLSTIKADLLLAALMFVLGVALLVYLSETLVVNL